MALKVLSYGKPGGRHLAIPNRSYDDVEKDIADAMI